MEIKIKKLVPEAVIPQYKTEGAAAFDMTAVSKTVVDNPGYGYIEYGLGVAMAIPKGFAGFLFPRSSISDTGLILANAVGVIDSDYRGEIKARFKFVAGANDYKVLERVCQMVILSVAQAGFTLVDELDETVRGEGGFGHTGK